MKKILTATALSLAMMSGLAFASTAPVPATTAKATTQQIQELSNVATQGFDAVRNMQYARLAIFNGNPESAAKLTDEAAKLLADDSTNWKDFAKQVKDPALTKNGDYILIDASITLDENYVATPDKENALKSANEKMKSGDQKGALDDLRLAGVGVNETQYLMPLKLTRDAVAKALQQLKAGQYYEANLTLRDAEQAIVTDSETLIAGK